MSYSEIDGQVVLTMSRHDYGVLLMALGFARQMPILTIREWLEFVNRVNEGNPDYRAYIPAE